MSLVLDTNTCYERNNPYLNKEGPLYLGLFKKSEMVVPNSEPQSAYVVNTFEYGTCGGDRVGKASTKIIKVVNCKAKGGNRKQKTRKHRRNRRYSRKK